MTEKAKAAETYGLRYGVLYEASPRELSVWARNVNPQNSYDQNYGLFLMVSVPADDEGPFAGQTWMIDTYHISRTGTPGGWKGPRDDAYIKQAAERDLVPSGAVGHWQWDCYYNACVQLSASNAHRFREVADLREWQFVADREVADYREEDVIRNVMLFREHGYPGGICIRRRGAEKDAVRQARAMLNRVAYEMPSWSAYGAEHEMAALERFAFDHRDEPAVIDAYEQARPKMELVAGMEAARRRLTGRDRWATGQTKIVWDEETDE